VERAREGNLQRGVSGFGHFLLFFGLRLELGRRVVLLEHKEASFTIVYEFSLSRAQSCARQPVALQGQQSVCMFEFARTERCPLSTRQKGRGANSIIL
jgi:hypothetical protein